MYQNENLKTSIIQLCICLCSQVFILVCQKMASVVRSHSQKENELKFLKFYNENLIIINSTDVTQTPYPNVLISVACLSCLKLLLVWYIVYKARLCDQCNTYLIPLFSLYNQGSSYSIPHGIFKLYSAILHLVWIGALLHFFSSQRQKLLQRSK